MRKDGRRALRCDRRGADARHLPGQSRRRPQASGREAFAEELFQTVALHPVTLEVARLAGRIHGEQMGRGIAIDFPDLIIGATALHLGFDVVTLNVEHFQAIPGLTVVIL
jgi:predicted nucleic acid-binding protein